MFRRFTHKRLLPYTINGIIFTLIGPYVFWMLYPLGPFLSVFTTDFLLHLCRFNSFKYFVFKSSSGYQVTITSYLSVILPVFILRLAIIQIFHPSFSRTILTILLTAITILSGFIFSQIAFKLRK